MSLDSAGWIRSIDVLLFDLPGGILLVSLQTVIILAFSLCKALGHDVNLRVQFRADPFFEDTNAPGQSPALAESTRDGS
jgi:hypothetical protein